MAQEEEESSRMKRSCRGRLRNEAAANEDQPSCTKATAQMVPRYLTMVTGKYTVSVSDAKSRSSCGRLGMKKGRDRQRNSSMMCDPRNKCVKLNKL